MPNVMAAQPNIGGALCESSVIPFLVPRRKVWLTPAAGVSCSNAANIEERKTWTTTTPQPFYGPISGTTRVSRCQKRTSGLYGAREDLQRQTH